MIDRGGATAPTARRGADVQRMPWPATAVHRPRGGGDVATSVLGIVTMVAMLLALYGAFIASPPEARQGDLFRIFYFHVPLALLTYVAFFVVFVASVLFLWTKSARWDRLARSSAEIGLLFCTLVLATGSLWGRPIWGVWWTWDARLTSTLVLWFIYLAYLMIRSYVDDRSRAARYAAVLGIVGFLDVPVVQFSVNWWRTLHPKATITASLGQSLPPSMQAPFGMSMLAVALLFVYLLVVRQRIETLRDEARALARQLSEAEEWS